MLGKRPEPGKIKIYTIALRMQLSITPDGLFAFSYGVYSSSTNQKLIVTDISSATKQASRCPIVGLRELPEELVRPML